MRFWRSQLWRAYAPLTSIWNAVIINFTIYSSVPDMIRTLIGRSLARQIVPRLSFPMTTRADSKDPQKYFEDYTFRNYVIESEDSVGILAKIMGVFNSNNISVSYIDNQFYNKEKNGKHRVDFNISTTPMDSEQLHIVENKLAQFNAKIRPGPIFDMDWYPRNEKEFNQLGKVLLEVNETEGKDSLQFQDKEYRKRRDEIARLSKQHVFGTPISDVKYSKEEVDVWIYCYDKLRKLHKKCMSGRFEQQITKLERQFDFKTRIPQLNELDQYLFAETQFRIRPTIGILSQREFLNAFAHRVFCSTQYIRHPSNPEYTPEPDIVHEIVGHIPLFADKDVADLSHEIGLLSLGATDKEISQLGTLYWYTLEFGACREKGEIKGYGAGIGSSFGQLEHFMSGKPKFEPFDPQINIHQPYPIQTVQPVYKVTESFEQALYKLREFGKTISKKAHMHYDFGTRSIITNRQVRGIYRGESANPL